MIRFDSPEVALGGVVTGALSWGDLPPPQGATVWIVWRTQIVSKGLLGGSDAPEDDYYVVAAVTLDDVAEARFELPIPRDGPVSHEGELLRVIWEAVAGTNQDGRVTIDARATFRVASRGTISGQTAPNPALSPGV